MPPSSPVRHSLGDPQWEDTDVPLVALDLASVETYLLVSQLAGLVDERQGAVWCPLISPPAPLDLDLDTARLHAEAMSLPFERPELHHEPVPRTMRVATLAAARSRAAIFMVRATRLAWATGGDLDRLFDSEAGHEFTPAEDGPDGYLRLMAREIAISVHEAKAAAADRSVWDVEMHSIAQGLERVGIDTAPALRWRGALHVGFDAISAVLPEPGSLPTTCK
jgi:hypothetical protein